MIQVSLGVTSECLFFLLCILSIPCIYLQAIVDDSGFSWCVPCAAVRESNAVNSTLCLFNFKFFTKHVSVHSSVLNILVHLIAWIIYQQWRSKVGKKTFQHTPCVFKIPRCFSVLSSQRALAFWTFQHTPKCHENCYTLQRFEQFSTPQCLEHFSTLQCL